MIVLYVWYFPQLWLSILVNLAAAMGASSLLLVCTTSTSGSLAIYFFNIFSWYIFVLDPSLLCRRWIPYDSSQYMAVIIALIPCYSLLGVISILGLLPLKVCNVSETSVVLPGPASMNPPNIHITL